MHSIFELIAPQNAKDKAALHLRHCFVFSCGHFATFSCRRERLRKGNERNCCICDENVIPFCSTNFSKICGCSTTVFSDKAIHCFYLYLCVSKESYIPSLLFQLRDVEGILCARSERTFPSSQYAKWQKNSSGTQYPFYNSPEIQS